jgi:hypothetical protein
MISEKQYLKLINRELRHHKVPWFKLLGIQFYRRLKVEDIRPIPDWYQKYTMTTKQHAEWKEWCIKYLMKKTGHSEDFVRRQFTWVDLNHGLMIKD